MTHTAPISTVLRTFRGKQCDNITLFFLLDVDQTVRPGAGSGHLGTMRGPNLRIKQKAALRTGKKLRPG